MTEAQKPVTTPAAANQEPQPSGALYDVAKELLANERIKALPEDQQGLAIVDRFIGTLVRHGELTDSKGNMLSPKDALKSIDDAVKLASHPKLQSGEWITGITRTDGLRAAVDALADDIRIGDAGVWQRFSSRLVESKDGPTLTSLPMLEGYLYAPASKEPRQVPGAGWERKIIDEVAGFTLDPTLPGRWDTSHLMSSDVGLVRDTQKEWEHAQSDARELGVDMYLVRRSAEYMQHAVGQQREIGATALTGQVPNYDKLFQP